MGVNLGGLGAGAYRVGLRDAAMIKLRAKTRLPLVFLHERDGGFHKRVMWLCSGLMSHIYLIYESSRTSKEEASVSANSARLVISS